MIRRDYSDDLLPGVPVRTVPVRSGARSRLVAVHGGVSFVEAATRTAEAFRELGRALAGPYFGLRPVCDDLIPRRRHR